MQELGHSLNVILDEPVSKLVKDTQTNICDEVKEQRDYDPSPHLAIATKFMDSSKTGDFVETLINEFSNDTPFEITFSKFEPSDSGGYVFLNLDTESTKRLMDLNIRAMSALAGIGGNGHDGGPAKYDYFPHVSVIKTTLEDREKALKLVPKDDCNLKMTVKSFEVTCETLDENGFGKFPVVKTIELQ